MLKSVTIFGRTLPIKYLNQAEMHKLYPNSVGVWESTTLTIYICKDYPLKFQKNTLYHEMGHSILTFTGLDQVLPPEIQEILVQSFATLIEDVLKQSSKLK